MEVKSPWEKENSEGCDNLANFESWLTNELYCDGDNYDDINEKVSALPAIILCAMNNFKDHIMREYLKQTNNNSKAEGYRLLNENDIIKKGDEFYSAAREWCSTPKYNYGEMVGNERLPYRRKIRSWEEI